MAVDATAYITVVELQEAIKRSSTNSTTGATGTSDPDYNHLERSINNASKFIDQTTSTFYYSKELGDGIDGYEIVDAYGLSANDSAYIDDSAASIFFNAPIISIDSITEDGIVLVEGTDYIVKKKMGQIIRYGGDWTYTPNGISIIGNIGYETVPKYVKQWCIEIAGAFSGLATSAVTDAVGMHLGDIQKSNIPEWVMKSMLSNRRVMI